MNKNVSFLMTIIILIAGIGNFSTVSGQGTARGEETIWEELDRFIGSIRDEIRSDEPEEVSIDFWLFKIERRVSILKKHIEKDETTNQAR